MGWEVLQLRARQPSTEWRISVRPTGVTLWIPRGNALERVRTVVTMLGRDENEGSVRVVPSDDVHARSVNRAQKGTNGSAYVKWSTLPGSPEKMDVIVIKVKDLPEGGIEFRLPWTRATPDFSKGCEVADAPTTPRPPPPRSQVAPHQSIFDKQKPVSPVVRAAADFAFRGQTAK